MSARRQKHTRPTGRAQEPSKHARVYRRVSSNTPKSRRWAAPRDPGEAMKPLHEYLVPHPREV